MDPVTVLAVALSAYLGLGLAFAVPFVASWVERLDPAARGGTVGFRVLIVPGVAVLWPLFAARLARRPRRRGGA